MALVPITPSRAAAVIEEVKRNGFDPGVVRSCMPSSDLQRLGGMRGVVGCNMYDRCPFALTRNGGFKDHTWRPKGIIYYIEPNDGTTHAKEDMLPCHLYVQLLGNKARDGRIDLEEGRNGEIIQIIGIEVCDAAPEFDPKTMDHESKCPACGARHWYMENTMTNKGTSLMPNWQNTPAVKTCVPFVHPSAIAGLKHERDIRAAARARMADDPLAQIGPKRITADVNDDWATDPPIEPVEPPEKGEK